MGINKGFYNGIGVNPLLGQQFVGTATIRPTNNPDTSALVIQDTGAGRRGVGPLFEVFDFFGAPILSISALSGALVFGDYIGVGSSASGVGTNVLDIGMGIDGSKDPPCLIANAPTGPSAPRIYLGNLPPTHTNYPFLSGVTNDWFFNFSGSTSTTHIYRCSATGTPGTWVGFA